MLDVVVEIGRGRARRISITSAGRGAQPRDGVGATQAVAGAGGRRRRSYAAGVSTSPDRIVPAPPDGSGDVAVTVDGAVATLWLNRPAKRNSVTYEMWSAIETGCRRLADVPAVRVLVVRGTGDHFCAGADIGGLGAAAPSDYHERNAAAHEALATFPKPTIAFVAGSCVGGGAQIAAACDLRIADTSSRFGITPARLGISYPAFGVERIVRLVGPAAAKHLLFTAEIIDPARAVRIGLVDEVHEPAAAIDRLAELTMRLTTERSLLTQMASKEMVDEVVEHGRVDPATEARWRVVVDAAADLPEGIAAFLERRDPTFTWTPPRSEPSPQAQGPIRAPG